MNFNEYFKQYASKIQTREPTFRMALQLAYERKVFSFVETGTIRKEGNWRGDGYSTFLFADFAKQFGGHVWSCDIDPEHLLTAKKATKQLEKYITFIYTDSLIFLKNINMTIDFLYLDSHDGDLPGHAEHQLAEVKMAEQYLTKQSIILLDDSRSKPRLSAPYLKRQGWVELMHTDMQILFVK